MKFVDQILLKLRAGNGGNGKVSFFQDWQQKHRYPDGGNGGNGANIVFVADANLSTFQFPKTTLLAPAGQNGNSKNKHGKTAPDLLYRVPLGTLVWSSERKFFLCNFTTDKQKFIVAYGGTGGKGNAAFLSNTNRFPTVSQPGMLGETKSVFLELKMLANIGLFGMPNAGKSSLLNVLTEAKVKVGNYAFTTLRPNLGVLPKYHLVVTDLPGIIRDAHLNRGLGNRFLKHAERCELLAYVIDLATPYAELTSNFTLILNELFRYNPLFQKIPLFLLANKIDLPEAKANQARFKQFLSKNYPAFPFLFTSASTRENILTLIKELTNYYQQIKNRSTVLGLTLQNHPQQQLFEYKIHRELRLQKLRPNTWFLSGRLINNLNAKYDLSNPLERTYFNRHLKRLGIEELLFRQNVRDGDTIFIANQSFIWKPAN